MKIAITGANSSVGLNLLGQQSNQADLEFIAGVRSERAKASLPVSEQIEAKIISYEDVSELTKVIRGASCVVHLAGILMENKTSNYQKANVAATASVVKAALESGAKHFVFISVVGASDSSDNAYFRSKGLAEKIVANSGLSASIIRTPILLGPDTAGANALYGAASQPKTKVLGGGEYSQCPLDIDDLNTAILNCCKLQKQGAQVYELVGPEAITYKDLIIRTANMIDKQVEVGSIPLWLAKLGARVTGLFKDGGITATVIDVITKDEVVEANSHEKLGVKLTPLNDTLEKIITKKMNS